MFTALIDLNQNELYYYPFNDLSSRLCVPNKAEDGNLSFLNMVTRISESKTLTKHIS